MKLKSPGKRTIRTLMVAGVAVASVGAMVLNQTQAFADPGFTYVAVGSDTVQDFENAWAANLTPGLVASYNATNPVNNNIHEPITPAKAGNSTSNGGPSNALPAEGCTFNRPNGSSDGITALRASLSGTPSAGGTTSTAAPIAGYGSGSTALPSNLPQQNCVDIARSSSTPGTFGASNTSVVDPSNGYLVYIPFAVDGVTVATGSTASTAPTASTAGTSTVPDGCSNAAGTTTNACVATPATNLPSGLSFSLTELQNLYAGGLHQADVNGNGCYYPFGTTTDKSVPSGCTPLDLYVPQAGSGTLKFWAQALGFSATSLEPWIYQTIQADTGAINAGQTGTVSSFVGATVEEHDGTAVTVDPNGIFPFSIAQYISQNAGHNPRFHQAVLQDVNNVAPETSTGALNVASFPIQLLREVYNVVAWDRVNNTGDGNFDPTLSQLLVSTSSSPSLLCRQKGLIASYGFALMTPTAPSPAGLGGEVGGHFCGQIDQTNLRTYGPSTGF